MTWQGSNSAVAGQCNYGISNNTTSMLETDSCMRKYQAIPSENALAPMNGL